MARAAVRLQASRTVLSLAPLHAHTQAPSPPHPCACAKDGRSPKSGSNQRIGESRTFLRAQDLDLAATFGSGQVFRWRHVGAAWEGIVQSRWVRLNQVQGGILAECARPVRDWQWLEDYLRLDDDLGAILRTFPDDDPLRAATAACRGLRLLRQPPWECLASFVLSSTKQIVQIQQMVELLGRRYGDPLATPPGHDPVWGFPNATRLAACTDRELRECKLGFRAPYLAAIAGQVAAGTLDLEGLRACSTPLARRSLMALPGVGPKIADCVLLFAYGRHEVFPVDVWIARALREFYHPHRRMPLSRLRQFSEEHFGPHAGYAQQYLFHFMRMRAKRSRPGSSRPSLDCST